MWKESIVFFVKVDPLRKANCFVKVEGDDVKSKLNVEKFPYNGMFIINSNPPYVDPLKQDAVVANPDCKRLSFTLHYHHPKRYLPKTPHKSNPP